MTRREAISRIVVLTVLVVIPLGILGYQYWLRSVIASPRVIDVVATVPEAGGFQPNAISVQAGETVTLRFRSADVTHGVAIGPALGIDLGEIEPGHVKEVTLTFDKAGTYTFYCNTWCSPNHWRMRGVVDVRDTTGAQPVPQHDPVIDRLTAEAVDIDAYLNEGAPMPGMASTPVPTFALQRPPSAQHGATLFDKTTIPADLNDLAWRQAHTPAQALETLAVQNPGSAPADLMDMVAYLWTKDAKPDALANAAALYNKNCAACHGQTGDGQGIAASQVLKSPAVFSDPARMALRRSDVLYAKIRRGGMGTGMPNYGTVFTPGETWELVDYLWQLSFRPK
jgi:plastocyanin/mono/diheme cytochrome c family protein